MRKILFAALFAVSFSAFAQETLTVAVVRMDTGRVTQLYFLVDIPQTTVEDVEKNWLKYVATGSSGRAVIVDGIYHQAGAYNGNISPYSFFVHSKLLDTSDGVRLSAWFTQDDMAFISADLNSDQSLAAQKYLRDFAVQEYRRAVQKELEAAESRLIEMENELTVMNRDEEKSIKTIKDNDRSTVLSNDAIVTNNTDIQSSSDKIDVQKEIVDQTTSGSRASKGAKKKLGNLEKDKRNLQIQNETEGKSNDGRAKENRKEARNMVDGKQHQKLKTEDIEAQRLKVHEVKTKLDGIQ